MGCTLRLASPANPLTPLARCTLIDVTSFPRESVRLLAAAVFTFALGCPSVLIAQNADLASPPQNAGFFPLSQIRPGMSGTAWTVFQGTKPEPMQVEILGVLRGARGPGQDLIIAQLHGAKPEYTGVVEGMSGSPVYIDGKLAGSLSYRIGQFAKDPIAGITPIEQMLEVRDLSVRDLARNDMPAERKQFTASLSANDSPTTFQPMETPLVMSGFRPEAIRFWQQQTAGTILEPVSAGGGSASSGSSSGSSSDSTPGLSAMDSAATAARASIIPGSSVSMQLIRGDLESSATCTVTYIDPHQLLACGHPVLGSGPISLPMTSTDVIATLASPLNAFKIINTGATIGAFTQDRESAIRGVLGAEAHMIPLHITVDAPEGSRKVNVEVLDLPSLTPQAVEVVLFNSLLETNESSDALSYHVTGNISLTGFTPIPVDVWASAGESAPAPLLAALQAGTRFDSLYSNGARQGAIRAIDLHVQAIPRHLQVALEQAHIISSDIAHAGDTLEVEATLRPWQQPAHNVRIAIKLPARLAAGNLRLLISDGPTLDRTLQQPRLAAPPPDLAAVIAQASTHHASDRVYISLLAPETQGEVAGRALTGLPLSVANALEPMRDAQNAGLNGESAELLGDASAGGVLSGFQILDLHIDAGGGLR